jgi:hypothetical protein
LARRKPRGGQEAGGRKSKKMAVVCALMDQKKKIKIKKWGINEK